MQEKMKLQKAGQAAGQQAEDPSVAEQVMQEAQQEIEQETLAQRMQERMRPQMRDPGIDQLASNLPTYDSEEMGMAGGGIVAFAERGQVRDPEQDPLIVALRQDPAYLAFAESGGVEGDTSLTAFLQAGNTPTPPRASQSSLPMSSDSLEIGEAGSGNVYSPFMRGETGNRAALNYRNQRPRDRVAKGRELPQENLPLSALDFDAPVPIAPQPQTAPQVQKFPDEFPEEAASVNAGIAAAPGARTVNPVVPGAPRAVPQGGGTNTLSSGARPSMGASAPQPQAQAQPESAMDRYARMLEAQGDDSAKLRKEAQAMALIQMGLGIAGGTSPNALENLKQGAIPAIQSLQQTMQGLRKDDRDRIKQLMEMGVSKEKLALEVRKLGIEDKKAEGLLARYAAMGAGGGEKAITPYQKELLYKDARTGLNTATTAFNKAASDSMYKMNLGIANDPKKSQAERNKAKAFVDAHIGEAKANLDFARDLVNRYDPSGGAAPSGAGTLPPGLPPGSVPIGKSGGKTVYRTPDGRQLVEE
jgi:hypothetical protein